MKGSRVCEVGQVRMCVPWALHFLLRCWHPAWAELPRVSQVSLCGLGTSSRLISGVGSQDRVSWARLLNHSGGSKGHPCLRGTHFLGGACGDVDTVTWGSP